MFPRSVLRRPHFATANVRVLDSLESRLAPAAGFLDSAFGTAGLVAQENAGFSGSLAGSGEARTVAILPGGETILGGPVAATTSSFISVAGFAFQKYTAGGQIDATYGNQGRAYVHLSGANLTGYSGRVNADGSVLIAGVTGLANQQEELTVYRLTPAGSLDAAFGIGGKRSTLLRPPSAHFFKPDGFAPNTTILPNGSVIVVGGRNPAFTPNLVAARVTQSGSLDSTFDGDGVLSLPFAGGFQPQGITVDSGGILIAGTDIVQGTTGFAVVRLNNDGSLDANFGTNGLATFGIGHTTTFTEVVVQPAGGIVVAGNATIQGDSVAVVARFTANGDLDGSFGTDGAARFALGSFISAANDIEVLTDGRVAIAGRGDGGFAAARLTADGILDQTFGDGGIRTYFFDALSNEYFNGIARGIAVQADGSVLLVGGVTREFGIRDFAAARLTGDSPPALAITPSVVPLGAFDQPYSVQLAAPGATAFTLTSGTLPDGLSLSASGLLSGTPIVSTPFTQFTITASNGTASVSQVYTMRLFGPVQIGPASLPNAVASFAYSPVAFTGPGSLAPPGTYSFTLSAATFMPESGSTVNSLNGLTFANGQLGGTPAAAGTVRFTITATATDTPIGVSSASREFTLHVDPAPAIDLQPATYPDGVVGELYNPPGFTTGPNSPPGTYRYDLSFHFVPDRLVASTQANGLTATAATGNVSGRPEQPGQMTIDVVATHLDSGLTATRKYSFRVNPSPIQISPALFPSAVYVGQSYDIPITASGAAAFYEIERIPVTGPVFDFGGAGFGFGNGTGELPANLSIATAQGSGVARFVGTLAAADNSGYRFRIKATDPITGNFATADFGFKALEAGRMSLGAAWFARFSANEPLPEPDPDQGEQSILYNVFGVEGSASAEVIFGSLPPGTYFQKSIHVSGTQESTRFTLVGTPTSGGTYYGTVQFVDSNGNQAAHRFFIIVQNLNASPPEDPVPVPPPAPPTSGPPVVLPPLPASTPTHSYTGTTYFSDSYTNFVQTTEEFATQFYRSAHVIGNPQILTTVLADTLLPRRYDPTVPEIAEEMARLRALVQSDFPDRRVEVIENGRMRVLLPYEGPLTHTSADFIDAWRPDAQTYRVLTEYDPTAVEVARSESLLETIQVVTVGPATIRVGPNGSDTLFVPAGTTNTNTITRIRRDIATVTRQTYTTTKYVIVHAALTGGGGGANQFTVSVRTLPTLVESQDAQASETAGTRIVGTFNGVNYDVMLDVAYDPSNPAIRAAIAAARASNRAAGAVGGETRVGAAVRSLATSNSIREEVSTVERVGYGLLDPLTAPFRIAPVDPHEFDGFHDLVFGSGPGGISSRFGPSIHPTGDDLGRIHFTGRGDSAIDLLFDQLETTNRIRTTAEAFQTLTTIEVIGSETGADHVYLRAVGADVGGGPHVKAFTVDGAVAFNQFVYEPTFTGGVRVATGDVTGDGVDDVLTAAGDGGGPRIQIFDGTTGEVFRNFMAFPDTLRVGVFVSVADINHDGYADYAVTPGTGGGPRIALFDGRTGERIGNDFLAFDEVDRNGITVALSETGIAVGQFGGGSHVKLFDLSGSLIAGFEAFENFTGGVNLAFDPRGELLIGAGPGGSPTVLEVDSEGTVLSTRLVGNEADREGVRVGTVETAMGATVVTAAGAEIRSESGESLPAFDDVLGLAIWVS